MQEAPLDRLLVNSEQSEQVVDPKQTTSKKRSRLDGNTLWLLTLTLVVAVAGLYEFGQYLQRSLAPVPSFVPLESNASPSLIPAFPSAPPSEQVTPNLPEDENLVVRTVAPDESLIFTYYSPTDEYGDSEECPYLVQDALGMILDISDKVGKATLQCHFVSSFYTNEFLGLGNEGKIYFEFQPNEILVVNALKDIENVRYQYDADWGVAGIDRDGQYLMLQEKLPEEGSISLRLENMQTGAIVETIDFNEGLFRVHYDEVNHGFLLVTREYGEAVQDAGFQEVVVRFRYLSLVTLQLRQLFEDSGIAAGRGCGPVSMESESGVIRYYHGGCFSENPDDFSGEFVELNL